MKKLKKMSKTSNWIVDHFSLTYVNLSLASMLSFHVWHQNDGKMFGVNSIISLAYIKSLHAPLLEPWQNNLSNPEAYLEACQTSKIVFCKNSQLQKAVNCFWKHSILDVLQSFEYTYVICYSLVRKIEEANKIDSVRM